MSLDDAELAARHILIRLANAEAVEFVSSRGAAALASEAGRVLLAIEEHPRRATAFAEWLIDQVEVADLFIADSELEAVLVEDWDARMADPGPQITARDPALEATILADPDDVQRFLVYGDWLQSHGDRHGELIVRQAAAQGPGTREADALEAERWLLTNANALLGPLGEYLRKVIRVDWHMGFIRRAAITRPVGDEDTYQSDVLLGWLLDHRVSLLLRDLEIEPLESNHSDQTQAIIDRLAAQPLERLEHLTLRSQETAELAPLASGLANLATLSLQTERVRLCALDLPRLRTLEFDMASPAASIMDMFDSKLPALETLSLLGHVDVGHPGMVRLLEGSVWPTLRQFGASGHRALLEGLAGSTLLRGLETLELAHGRIDDVAVSEVLIARRDRFRHLKRLVLDGNRLTDAGVERVLKVFPSVEVSAGLQQVVSDDYDDDDYYDDDME